MGQVRFRPGRMPEDEIPAYSSSLNGRLWFATDTGKIYLDTATERVLMGSSGVSLLYGNATVSLDENDETIYILPYDEDSIENYLNCREGDLILNKDGCFYRVETIDKVNSTVECKIMSISGGGGGTTGSSYAKAASITIGAMKTVNFINGQPVLIVLTPNSAIDSEGGVLDDYLTISWSLTASGESKPYDSGLLDAVNGESYTFDLTNKLRESTTTVASFAVIGINSGTSKTKPVTINTYEMTLSESFNFSALTLIKESSVSSFNIPYIIGGGAVAKIVDFYIDGSLVQTKNTEATGESYFTVKLSDVTHGVHTFKIVLSQSISNERGHSLDPIEYQLAILKNGETAPVIWFGSYDTTYYSYDKIQIPFMVYDPTSATGDAVVNIYQGTTPLDISPLTINYDTYANAGSWYLLELTDPEIDAYNAYSLSCTNSAGETTNASIEIYVATDPNRDMSLVQLTELLLNFSAAGRSNSESEYNRQRWSYTATDGSTKEAVFSDFNWYNNGWVLDDDKNTCLRISNGASFAIPISPMTINSNSIGQKSCTFEIEFKVKNIQNYSDLIKEITRYTDDEEYWKAFRAQSDYDNYDTYLQKVIFKDDASGYDNLEFSYNYKETNTDAAICQYYNSSNGIGLCLGPQDGFFTTGTNTVNVDYVEDKLVNLSVVFEKDTRIYMYINGILTSITSNTASDAIVINSDAIVFNSQFCDIDLYKFRVYRDALTVRDIDINYSVDHRDVLIYDETNQLAVQNNSIGEYQINFDNMLAFNEANPNNYIMPYMIISTAKNDTDRLPYSKLNPITVSATFVNTGLERAYKSGKLDALAAAAGYKDKEGGQTAVEQYYLHHCPSWTGDNINLTVQGTSSEFYPRRNYKMKTQIKTYTIQTDDEGNKKYKSKKSYAMNANLGPFADNPENLKYFYMDNDSVGTNKFTLKIDYMESSGSYNVGLANLVYNAYAGKHPLDDYGLTNEVNTKDLRTNVKGFPILMFHEKSDGTKTYIGRYNMLLDKGSDDCYGFSADAVNKFVLDEDGEPMALEDVAECWEFSDNARGYCSFRDPYNREVLSFRSGTAEDYSDEQLASSNTDSTNKKVGTPVVVDSFEYRYHKDADLLDYYYNPSNFIQKAQVNQDYAVERLEQDYGDKVSTEISVTAPNTFAMYSNWEKACQWVWSTCTDNVPSLGTYEVLSDVSEALYEPNLYYIIDTISASGDYTYKMATDSEYNDELVYYRKVGNEYNAINLTTEEKYVYQPNTFYYMLGSNYILDDSDSFDDSRIYYQLIEDSTIQAKELATPVTYKGITYKKDTKEYRLAKFKNEFSQHFNLNYSLIYFVVTEVLMLYDSRGKNCMMASWGPQTAGGDYIWYPIFYDMDTQLGINNTGIPSFEYYVNATQDGCFSTNDSVLWGNLYNCFFSEIKSTYYALRSLNQAFRSVDYIENWYKCSPEVDSGLAYTGERPLIALNLDEWYKYISITNSKVQYLDKTGNLTTDSSGTYFYALQGDRSLSRQQFLSKRLNFIDGWLTYGPYSRSSGVAIWGRVSANDPTNTSDKWVEGEGLTTDGQVVEGLLPNVSYYVKDSLGNITYDSSGNPIKTNYLDADTYIELTPYQRSYVTIGGDNEALPSVEVTDGSYRYTVPMSESIKTSGRYAEQLLYIYGANYLQSIGDVSRMYWREFYAENAPKLRTILLGSDYPGFFNNKLKFPNLDASTNSSAGKPLLEEVNLTNVKIDQDTDVNLDFTSSEKLKIFKALGSNLAEVKFADGVALNTLYLPDTVKSIRLTEARNLTSVISDKDVVSPTEENFDTWTAPKGLYVKGLTDKVNTSTTSIITLSIAGGSLGYGSYELLKDLYDVKRVDGKSLAISLTDVDWCPYEQLTEGYQYNTSEASKYFKADDHYQMVPYTEYTTDKAWNLSVINGEIYKIKDDYDSTINIITDPTVFSNLITSNQFTNTQSGSIPLITGVIYINNDTAVEESEIRNTYQAAFPNVTFFFAKVKAAYSAKFIRMEDDGTYTTIDTQKIAAGTTNAWFENPYSKYDANTLDSMLKLHYDFLGWSTSNSADDLISSADAAASEQSEAWTNARGSVFKEDSYDYTFYAIYTIHKYNVTFYNGEKDSVVIPIAYGSNVERPSTVPYIDDSDLPLTSTYSFVEYTNTKTSAMTNNYLVLEEGSSTSAYTDITKKIVMDDMTFYPVFQPSSVYDNIHPEYFTATVTSTTECSISVNSKYTLTGKITVPTTLDGYDVTSIAVGGFSPSGNYKKPTDGVTHIFWQKDNRKVKTIPNRCFMRMTNLLYFEMPESVTAINDYAFANCYSLFRDCSDASASNYYVEQFLKNIVTIGTQAFIYNQIKDLKISNVTTSIGSYAFAEQLGALSGESSKLKTVVIGSNSGTGSQLVAANCGNYILADNITANYITNVPTIESITCYFSSNDEFEAIQTKFFKGTSDSISEIHNVWQ